MQNEAAGMFQKFKVEQVEMVKVETDVRKSAFLRTTSCK